MSQLSFSDAEYLGKRKRTRREVFLSQMEQVVPWAALVGLIERHSPKARRGCRPYALETTLLHFRHLLEQHGLCARRFEAVSGDLQEKGLLMRHGTIVDATIIAAPSSTKKQERGARPGDASDPEGPAVVFRNEGAYWRGCRIGSGAYGGGDGGECGRCQDKIGLVQRFLKTVK